MKNPLLHRLRAYPQELIVDIHTYCNARCTMCPYPRYSRQQSQGQMEWALYQRIVDEFARLGREHKFRPRMTYCYMSEPFLAEDLPRYVKYALENNIELYLNTNAGAMTREKLDALLETGFKGEINISFHGITPKVYERITGLEFQKSLQNTLYLLDKYNTRNVLIRGVDDKWPDGEKELWLTFWKEKNVRLEYLPPISRCGAIGRILNKARGKGEGKKVQKDRLYGCRCNLPLYQMVILFDGQAVMCCQDMGRELIWGDVGQEGIEKVWNGPVRKEAIDQLYTGATLPKSFLCCRCEEALDLAGMIRSLCAAAWHKVTRINKKSRAAIW